MFPNSLRLRLLAGAGIWAIAALIVGGWALSSLFRDYVESDFDARLLDRMQALIAAGEADADGRLVLLRRPAEAEFRRPYSGLYWQISNAAGVLARSRSLWDVELPAPAGDLAAGPIFTEVAGPAAQRLRVAARRIALSGLREEVIVQLAGDRARIEERIGRFNRLLAGAFTVLGLGLLAAVLLQVQIGLRPLARVRETLSEIREGRAERLRGPFPDELRPLADEINGLLAHNAEVVERARTQAGNLAHALKNPLAVLRNEASAAEGELAETVLSRGSEMQRQIDRHLARARAAGRSGLSGTRCDPAPILARLLRTLEQLHGQRGLAVDLRCDEGAAFAGETGDLEEMLGNLLDNAFKWAAGEIRVTAEIRDGRLLVTIDDDGPGLPEAERRTALRRGGRLDEAVPGSGLGLAIVGDIAELYGGELSLEEAPSGGLRARLTLPSAA